jgi:hypothetical protein
MSGEEWIAAERLRDARLGDEEPAGPGSVLSTRLRGALRARGTHRFYDHDGELAGRQPDPAHDGVFAQDVGWWPTAQKPLRRDVRWIGLG